MTREEIEQIVLSYIKQSSSGLEIENPKFDFKAKWYDLTKKKDINEFLKDTSAIANTFGLDGLIVIGYDNKANTYHDTKFQDSKLSDTSKITDLINKRVDRLFEINIYDLLIEGHNLSAIHIPPSIDKPHVISNYQTFEKSGDIKKEEQHKIFVRKGTSTFPASKNDIELMFYDRKNVIPDYKVLSSYHADSLNINISGPILAGVKQVSGLNCTISLTLENLGRRPVAITEISIQLTIWEDPSYFEKIDFTSEIMYKSNNIVIQPNEITNQIISFQCKEIPLPNFEGLSSLVQSITKNKKSLKAKYLTLKLSNGVLLQSELIQASN